MDEKTLQDILWDEEDDFPESPDLYKEQLDLFEKELRAAKLAEKTINKHLGNVFFYLNVFGADYEMIDNLKDGCYKIDEYLGDWYVDKCFYASKSDCKSQSASIKKFYKCMADHVW